MLAAEVQTRQNLDEITAAVCVSCECWKENSTENYIQDFKATSKPLLLLYRKPVMDFSTTQAITQFKGNIVSGLEGTPAILEPLLYLYSDLQYTSQTSR